MPLDPKEVERRALLTNPDPTYDEASPQEDAKVSDSPSPSLSGLRELVAGRRYRLQQRALVVGYASTDRLDARFDAPEITGIDLDSLSFRTAEKSSSSDEGVWRTVWGASVLVAKDGTVIKGPKKWVGRNVEDLDKPATEEGTEEAGEDEKGEKDLSEAMMPEAPDWRGGTDADADPRPKNRRPADDEEDSTDDSSEADHKIAEELLSLKAKYPHLSEQSIQLFLDPDVIQARNNWVDTWPTFLDQSTERRCLGARIAEHLYGDGALCKDRMAWFLLGPPASGKSLIAPRLAERVGAVAVDPDQVAERLPEYDQGVGASAVLEEAASIAGQLIFPRAVLAGDNLVIPLVGKTTLAAETLRDALLARGYGIHLVLFDTSPDSAVDNAVFRMHSKGAFTPLEYVNTISSRAQETYQYLCEAGQWDAKTWYHRVDREADPDLIEHEATDGSESDPLGDFDWSEPSPQYYEFRAGDEDIDSEFQRVAEVAWGLNDTRESLQAPDPADAVEEFLLRGVEVLRLLQDPVTLSG